MVCRRTLKTRYEVLDLGQLPHFSAGPHCTLFGWQYWSLHLGFFACLPSSWSHCSHSVALTVVAQRSQLPSFSGMRHPPPCWWGIWCRGLPARTDDSRRQTGKPQLCLKPCPRAVWTSASATASFLLHTLEVTYTECRRPARAVCKSRRGSKPCTLLFLP